MTPTTNDQVIQAIPGLQAQLVPVLAAIARSLKRLAPASAPIAAPEPVPVPIVPVPVPVPAT